MNMSIKGVLRILSWPFLFLGGIGLARYLLPMLLTSNYDKTLKGMGAGSYGHWLLMILTVSAVFAVGLLLRWLSQGEFKTMPTPGRVCPNCGAALYGAAVTTCYKCKAPQEKSVGDEIDQRVGITQIRTIDRTGDAFIDSCFHFDFIVLDEVRDWSQIPEAAALVKKANESIFSGHPGKVKEAIILAEELRKKYPDFDFCYAWLGELYLHLNSYGEAQKAVADGLRLARSKDHLCEKMAMIHLKVCELDEAVKWWIRALVIEISARKQNNIETLLYLSYVAEALELDIECQALRNEVDRISTSGFRLASDIVQNLSALSQASGSPSLKRAIALFVREYISVESDRRLEELRRAAPKGIYCKDCNTRYSVEQITWHDIGGPGSRSIFYRCPTCQCNLAYYPEKDIGV